LPVSHRDLRRSVIVCSDVIEHLVRPDRLLATLSAALRHARLLILSTPDRDLAHELRDMGPPANPSHVREWNLAEFAELLEHHRLRPSRIGLTRSDDRSEATHTILAMVKGGERADAPTPAPQKMEPARVARRMWSFLRARSDFREVVALISTYNEADIIAYTIRKLTDQGIGVYLIDNWSTDSTLAQARLFEGRGLIGFERFPREPAPHYEWARILRRKEELHGELGARWYIHHDADEVRDSPWPGVSYREGILRADSEGFNCITHVVLEFKPTDDEFAPGGDMEAHFCYFHPGEHATHGVEHQAKAWKNSGQAIELVSSAGHRVDFPERRVYPIPFLLKHYPVRGQAHGRRKVLRERKQRYSPDERGIGWHDHYDHFQESSDFLSDPSGLELYDETTFKAALVGLPRREEVRSSFHQANGHGVAPEPMSCGPFADSPRREGGVADMTKPILDPGRHPILGDTMRSVAGSGRGDPPRVPIRKAVFLCTDERTGSQWLCQRIAATNRMGRPTEYFNRPWMSRYFPGYPEHPVEQYELAMRLGTTSNGVFSIKLHPFHLDVIRGSCDLYSGLRERYFVYLTRRDMLSQAISLVRARQTKRYHHDDETAEVESFDASLIEQVLKDLCLNRARWNLFFAMNGIQPFEVTYEALRQSPQKTIREIGRFIGVDLPLFPRRIPREHQIQSDETSQAWRVQFLAEKGDLNAFPTLRVAE
jgi:LPS sulfotransferase NodH